MSPRQSTAPRAVFAEGLETLGFEAALKVAADLKLSMRFGGCTPSDATDGACLSAVIRGLGLRLWRRPLTDQEVTAIETQGLAFAKERTDFKVGLRFVVQALLMNPAFAYRIEIGQPGTPRALTNHEVLSRLSYLVWATAPDGDMLAEAAGAAYTDQQLKALAVRLLADSRATAQQAHFHRLWIGYGDLRAPDNLRATMLAETDALVGKVLGKDGGAWANLFTARESYMDAALVQHYDAKAGANMPAWITYEHPERAGILSHGSFLSLAVKNVDDTSPTIRGKYIATRLLCREVPPPPPDVNADEPPRREGAQCKEQAYARHRDQGSACFACHELMDPVGFGLERFDGLGRYRTEEKGNAACQISGDGHLKDVGTFSGPRQLADLMLKSGELTDCAASQYFQFAFGRPHEKADGALVDRLQAALSGSGPFADLVLSLVADPVFRSRVPLDGENP